jgi:hypothetical protein
MTQRKWFEVVRRGNLFNGIDGGGPTGIDIAETHRLRDRVLIDRVRVVGEVLKHGLADPRKIGEGLVELANEADSLASEIVLGYE